MVSATTTNQGCHLQDRCSLHVRVYPNHFDVFFFYLMEKRKNVESEMKSKSFELSSIERSEFSFEWIKKSQTGLSCLDKEITRREMTFFLK